jgi:peptide deformylase
MRILHYPHPVLRQRISEVKCVEPALKMRVQEMLNLMCEARGVGLAASQVGLRERFFVYDPSAGEEKKSEEKLPPHQGQVLINPVILEGQGEVEEEEGCLSLPQITANIKRSEKVKIAGLDRDGKEIVLEAEGTLARIFQHEIDHLDGVLILDRMSLAARLTNARRLKALEKAFLEGIACA